MRATLGTPIITATPNDASPADVADVLVQLDARRRWQRHQRHQRHQHLHRPGGAGVATTIYAPDAGPST